MERENSVRVRRSSCFPYAWFLFFMCNNNLKQFMCVFFLLSFPIIGDDVEETRSQLLSIETAPSVVKFICLNDNRQGNESSPEFQYISDMLHRFYESKFPRKSQVLLLYTYIGYSFTIHLASCWYILSLRRRPIRFLSPDRSKRLLC